MNDSRKTRTLRWTARIWSLASILFLLFIFIGESISNPILPQGTEWIMMLFFPVGVLAGLLISWRNERIGGLLTIASLIAFYIVEWAATGNLAGGPWFALVAFPGLLFTIIGFIAPEQRHRWA